jgi:hypothetical protein
MTQTRERVWGLRDVGEYKAYRRGAVHYVGHKNAERLRRVQLDKPRVEFIVEQTPSGFAQAIEEMLQRHKKIGSPKYYEVKHGRV